MYYETMPNKPLVQWTLILVIQSRIGRYIKNATVLQCVVIKESTPEFVVAYTQNCLCDNCQIGRTIMIIVVNLKFSVK